MAPSRSLYTLRVFLHFRVLSQFLLITNLRHFFQCIYLFHFSTCFEQPSAYHQENWIVLLYHLVYTSMCRWVPGMPDRLTRHSPTQSDVHQMMHWFNSILLMMSTGLLETCKKGTAVLLQAWSGPEVSRKLRFPDFMTTARDDGKVVSLKHRPPLPPGNTPGIHFC